MISIRSFTGEFPRVPADKLPENAASLADGCDFAHGELRGLNAPSSYATLINSPKSLFTLDGINFLSWAYDVNVAPGPVLDDQFERVYYSTGDTSKGFRVTQKSQAVPTGGEPASSWKAGVPKPSSPITAQAVAASALPDAMELTWKFFYEANGLKYQEQTVSPTTIILGREYYFAAPALLESIEGTDTTSTATAPNFRTVQNTVAQAFDATPTNAIPCVQVIGKKPGSDSQEFMAYSSNSSFASENDTDGFNGLNVTLTAIDGGGVRVKFEYGAGFKQTRAFVYTAVNLWNEESAPSDPVLLTYDAMQNPQLLLPLVEASGYVPITRFRVYGSVTGSTGATDYQLVGEISTSGGTTTFNVTSKPADWTTLLDTIGNLPPESDLRSLCALPNGVMAAIKGREVHFSESYKPWAWNPENVIILPYGTVGAIVSGRSLVVTTTAQPYIITGLTPDGMSEEKIAGSIQAGVSQGGMCDCGEFVVYVSNDGLVTVRGGVASLAMGQRFFTREDWRTRYASDSNSSVLATMKLFYFDGALIAFGTNASNQLYAFVIRFDEAEGTFTQFSLLSGYTGLACGIILPQTDSLYLVQASSILRFAGGSSSGFTWSSRTFRLPRPKNFGWLDVRGSGTVNVLVYYDEELIGSFPVLDNKRVRLSAGKKAQRVSLTITGAVGAILKEIHLASTAMELANV